MAVGSLELIRPLSALVFDAAGCPPTLPHQLNTGGGAGLVAVDPTHAQVVLTYMVYQ